MPKQINILLTDEQYESLRVSAFNHKVSLAEEARTRLFIDHSAAVANVPVLCVTEAEIRHAMDQTPEGHSKLQNVFKLLREKGLLRD